ncbi:MULTISPECIES: DUF2378 family protein [Myxococcaceae]|uniref:DUF2378 family protein n=1 Tax=Myxococcaceae TaxID=31 RepID=UPI00188F9CCE|nr:DUF2378 family protein [Simulacricoccus sp. 17bor-14]
MQSLLFESLFVRGLEVDAALAADLRAAGFDAQHVQVRYPAQVFTRCVAVAQRRLYPGLSEEAAQRELGHAFVRGFLKTLVGRVIGAMLPLMGPQRLLGRMPEYMRLGDAPLSVKLRELGPHDYALDYTHETQALPHLLAGIVEEALALTRTVAQVETQVHDAKRFTLRARW